MWNQKALLVRIFTLTCLVPALYARVAVPGLGYLGAADASSPEADLQISTRQAAEAHIRHGFTAIDAGELGYSIAVFQHALRLAPLDALAHEGLGSSLAAAAHHHANLSAAHAAAGRTDAAQDDLNSAHTNALQAVWHLKRAVTLSAPAYATPLDALRAHVLDCFSAFPGVAAEVLAGLRGEWWEVVSGSDSLRNALQSLSAETALRLEGDVRGAELFAEHSARAARKKRTANTPHPHELITQVHASGADAFLPTVPSAAQARWAQAQALYLHPDIAVAGGLLDAGYSRAAVQTLCRGQRFTVVNASGLPWEGRYNASAAGGGLHDGSLSPPSLLAAHTALRVCGYVLLRGAAPGPIPATMLQLARAAKQTSPSGRVPRNTLLRLLADDVFTANPLLTPVLHRVMQGDSAHVVDADIAKVQPTAHVPFTPLVQRLRTSTATLYELEDVAAPGTSALVSQRLKAVFGAPPHDRNTEHGTRGVGPWGGKAARVEATQGYSPPAGTKATSVDAAASTDPEHDMGLTTDFVPWSAMLAWPKKARVRASSLFRARAGATAGEWNVSLPALAGALTHSEHGFFSPTPALPMFQADAVFPLEDRHAADAADANGDSIQATLVPGTHFTCAPDLRAVAVVEHDRVEPMHLKRNTPTNKLVTMCPAALSSVQNIRFGRGDVLIMDSRLQRELQPVPGTPAAEQAGRAPRESGPGAVREDTIPPVHALVVGYGQAWDGTRNIILPRMLQGAAPHTKLTLSRLAQRWMLEQLANSSSVGGGASQEWGGEPFDTHDLNAGGAFKGTLPLEHVQPGKRYWSALLSEVGGLKGGYHSSSMPAVNPPPQRVLMQGAPGFPGMSNGGKRKKGGKPQKRRS